MSIDKLVFFSHPLVLWVPLWVLEQVFRGRVEFWVGYNEFHHIDLNQEAME